jgi:hypothetical protein
MHLDTGTDDFVHHVFDLLREVAVNAAKHAAPSVR